MDNKLLTVLISIHKKWADMIFSGEKTIEIRKSIPRKIDCPFTVYLYETKSTGKGEIIGEFTCNCIVSSHIYEEFTEDSKLTLDELRKYGNSKEIYGWHITNSKKYKKPIPLSKNEKAPQSWRYYTQQKKTI